MSQGNGQKHRRNTAGLREPWPKGVSGNPGGRPKGASLLAEIQLLLSGKDGKERRASAKAFVEELKRGSIQHAKEIIEREEGSVPSDGHVTVRLIHVRPDNGSGCQN